MKNLYCYLLLTGFLLIRSFPSVAQNSQPESANEQLNNRGEVYFCFTPHSPADIIQLTRMISVDNLREGKVYAYANRKQFTEFQKYSVDYQTLTPPSALIQAPMTDDPKQILLWNYYPTYTGYESLMAEFVTNHPDVCRLLTISTLASGRKLLVLKISDNPDIQENEPEFLYTSSIHGDETTGYVLMLHLIDYLLQNYGTDQRVTDMINSTELYINPLANPDGTYKGGNSTVNGATRGNANNVDLNRNYPDPEDGQHPDGYPWQPETVAFMNFAGFHHLTMGANFHGGAEVVNYPWDTWSRLAADNSWWVYVSREYADTVHLYAPSNYMNEYQNGITNGYAWYTISGGRQDYMNYFRHCREVTIEISDTKTLSASQLETYWNYNYRSFLNYLEECNYGLHGIVTDSITGEPLNAKVFISGHDIDSSHVYTDPAVGDYHRLLKGGTYNVTFSAAGYISKTIQVQITDRQKTNLDVQLYDGSLHANFKSDLQLIPTGTIVHFTDLSAGNPSERKWVFEGGTPEESTEINPTVEYDATGIYPVKLIISRQGESDSLLREAYIEVKEGFTMTNGAISMCDALFLDSGGPLAGYSNNESSVVTITPSIPENRIKVDFLEFDLENSTDCSNDRLTIYDGNSITAPLLGTYCGSTLPPEVMASNSEGALTFEFQSNGSVTGNGWLALLSCDSNVGIRDAAERPFSIYPNPVSNGTLRIKSVSLIERVTLLDETGRQVGESRPHSTDVTLQTSLKPGVYLVRIEMNGRLYAEKVLVLARD